MCLVSSLQFSRGFAVSMGSSKTVLFVALPNENRRKSRAKMLVLLFLRVLSSPRVSGVPVAAVSVQEAAKASFSKDSKLVMSFCVAGVALCAFCYVLRTKKGTLCQGVLLPIDFVFGLFWCLVRFPVPFWLLYYDAQDTSLQLSGAVFTISFLPFVCSFVCCLCFVCCLLLFCFFCSRGNEQEKTRESKIANTIIQIEAGHLRKIPQTPQQQEMARCEDGRSGSRWEALQEGT